jgi:hypothetical protein
MNSGGRGGGHKVGTWSLMVSVSGQVHPRSVTDRVRGACTRTSQDLRPKEHTKAIESAMAVMDCLSQNRNLIEQWSVAAVAMFRVMDVGGGWGGDGCSCRASVAAGRRWLQG